MSPLSLIRGQESNKHAESSVTYLLAKYEAHGGRFRLILLNITWEREQYMFITGFTVDSINFYTMDFP